MLLIQARQMPADDLYRILLESSGLISRSKIMHSSKKRQLQSIDA